MNRIIIGFSTYKQWQNDIQYLCNPTQRSQQTILNKTYVIFNWNLFKNSNAPSSAEQNSARRFAYFEGLHYTKESIVWCVRHTKRIAPNKYAAKSSGAHQVVSFNLQFMLITLTFGFRYLLHSSLFFFFFILLSAIFLHSTVPRYKRLIVFVSNSEKIWFDSICHFLYEFK